MEDDKVFGSDHLHHVNGYFDYVMMVGQGNGDGGIHNIILVVIQYVLFLLSYVLIMFFSNKIHMMMSLLVNFD